LWWWFSSGVVVVFLHRLLLFVMPLQIEATRAMLRGLPLLLLVILLQHSRLVTSQTDAYVTPEILKDIEALANGELFQMKCLMMMMMMMMMMNDA